MTQSERRDILRVAAVQNFTLATPLPGSRYAFRRLSELRVVILSLQRTGRFQYDFLFYYCFQFLSHLT